jgi:hypothetical protein
MAALTRTVLVQRKKDSLTRRLFRSLASLVNQVDQAGVNIFIEIYFSGASEKTLERRLFQRPTPPLPLICSCWPINEDIFSYFPRIHYTAVYVKTRQRVAGKRLPVLMLFFSQTFCCCWLVDVPAGVDLTEIVRTSWKCEKRDSWSCPVCCLSNSRSGHLHGAAPSFGSG